MTINEPAWCSLVVAAISMYGTLLCSVPLQKSPALPRLRSGQPRHDDLRLRLRPSRLTLVWSVALLGLAYLGTLRKPANVDLSGNDVTRSLLHQAVVLPPPQLFLQTLGSNFTLPEWYAKQSEGLVSPYDHVLWPEWKDSTTWLFVDTDVHDEEVVGLMRAVYKIETFLVNFCGLQDFPHSCETGAVPDIVFLSSSDAAFDKSRLGAMRKKWPKSTFVQLLRPCQGWDCPDQMALSSKTDTSVADVVLVRHAFEMIDLFDFNKLQSRYGDFRMPLIAHFPYASNAQEYCPGHDWAERTRDLLDLRLASSGVSGHDLRRAKICLLSSGSVRRISKTWVLAMLSGCVVFSDLPTEFQEDFEEIVLHYASSAAEETIHNILHAALANEADLQRRSLQGFIFARRWFLHDRQVAQVLQLIEQHRHGTRGYDFPFPFSAECRVYEDGLIPTWCGEGSSNSISPKIS